MICEILSVGALQCNCSIFGDETTRQAIVIDPGDGSDLDALEQVLDDHGLTVQAIVITHAHIDHIGGAARLKARTGAPVYMNPADQPASTTTSTCRPAGSACVRPSAPPSIRPPATATS